MDSLNKEFGLLLKNENDILEELSAKQKTLRKVLTEKNWDTLLDLMSEVNMLSDNFQKFDSRRDEIQNQLSENDLAGFTDAISVLRNKLLRCKVENQVIANYVTTTRQFIASVVQEAVPQIRNKNYNRRGEVLQPKPASVLVDVRG